MYIKELYAHTKNQQGKYHLLNEHLLSVADSIQFFTRDYYKNQFKPLATLIGLIHDLGKAHPLFQDYLAQIEAGNTPIKTQHSPWGAAFSYMMMQNLEICHEIALPIAGHHSGLCERGKLTAYLQIFCKEKEIFEIFNNIFQKLLLTMPIQNLKTPVLTPWQRELLIRMLFSALIDADRLDTKNHFSPEYNNIHAEKIGLNELVKKLKVDQEQLIIKSKNNPTLVNQIREEVYLACLARAQNKTGFFRLTVPTGGGKTRSSLAFALEHALINGQQRVIFAIPFTSIIDQTAKEYRNILGSNSVLEHHSQVIVNDEEGEEEKLVQLRLAEENWDMPVIVTTTVQLFESLFANKPTQCRKLHNVSNSVIVLDEAQSLPPILLKPTLHVLRDLVENYKTTVVLCTATQPALQGEHLQELGGMEITEIVPNFQEHFKKMKRVRYDRISTSSLGDLGREIAKYDRVLVIMNTRKKAIELLDVLKEKECLHLSTLLCGAHRRQVLNKVRGLLKTGESVYLISTQVVEAGVDLDFPVVYRELGPLDRIVQAAGRCNREGRPELGKVVIFELEGGKQPQGPYKAGIEEAKMLLAEYESLEILADPEIYKTYFTRLFETIGNDLDAKKIQEKREKLDFPAVADSYHLIEGNTVPMVVRYEGYKRILDEWLYNPNQKNWRMLQPYLVNVFKWEAVKLMQEGMVTEISTNLYIWEGLYDKVKGIGGMEFDPSDLII
jgi:CRISPR-associated endonuclease/helicase Cas3